MDQRRWYFLLKLCVSVTLIARGWLTWQWDSPIRGLIWKEDWWARHVESWDKFAKTSDPSITTLLSVLGIALILFGLVPWVISRIRWTRWLLLPATAILVIDSIARWVGTDYALGMAIEHSLQMIAPVVLFRVVSWPEKTHIWERVIAIATALTFVGHGLFAMGFHPVPLTYQTMTMSILHVSQDTALLLLKIAGVLDVVAAVSLFIRPARFVALGYIILWGGATALARFVAHGNIDPWLFETLVRTSHWMLPLLLWLSLRKAAPSSQPSCDLP